MIPVLAVTDREAAKRMLRDVFKFEQTSPDRMQLGDQAVMLCDTGAAPADLVQLPFDHLALSVVDADAALAEFTARGAELDTAFTPDGPAEIPAFWSNGVRFVFFQGPDGAPFEFCQKLGDESGPAHSHYGLRTSVLDQTEGDLLARGATRVARHVLPGTPPVEVRFLKRGDEVFELFDEVPKSAPTDNTGWIGVIEPDA